MKLQLLSVFMMLPYLVSAQINISKSDQVYLNKIQYESASKTISHTDSRFHVINGTPYISVLAKVNTSFSPNDLPSNFILGSQIGAIITLKIPASSNFANSKP